jgi:hypothetical protein
VRTVRGKFVANFGASEESAMEDGETPNRAGAVSIALVVLLDAVLHVSPEVEEHAAQLVHRRDVALGEEEEGGGGEGEVGTFVFRKATRAQRIRTCGGKEGGEGWVK